MALALGLNNFGSGTLLYNINYMKNDFFNEKQKKLMTEIFSLVYKITPLYTHRKVGQFRDLFPRSSTENVGSADIFFINK